MAVSSKQPSITFIIPTLNSGNVLVDCLQSIVDQKYPSEKIKIFIIDGGSTDSTLKIAKLYKCTIIKNPLKTGESAKAIGIRLCQTDFIALVDSDNILPDNDWLSTMILPLTTDISIIGSEPWSFTYRKNSGFIERYSSLIGANDPYTIVAKNYDRQNVLSGRWTGLNIPIVDHQYYQSVELNKWDILPTIGANGTIYRTSVLQKNFDSDYFFDIDFITNLLSKSQSINFAKVKTGIVHTYCESSVLKFYKKQLRRGTDLYNFGHLRSYALTKNNIITSLKFSLYVVLLFPMFFDTTKGMIIKPDFAWLFHPLACVITLYAYAIPTLKYKLGILKPLNRTQWRQ